MLDNTIDGTNSTSPDSLTGGLDASFYTAVHTRSRQQVSKADADLPAEPGLSLYQIAQEKSKPNSTIIDKLHFHDPSSDPGRALDHLPVHPAIRAPRDAHDRSASGRSRDFWNMAFLYDLRRSWVLLREFGTIDIHARKRRSKCSSGNFLAAHRSIAPCTIPSCTPVSTNSTTVRSSITFPASSPSDPPSDEGKILATHHRVHGTNSSSQHLLRPLRTFHVQHCTHRARGSIDRLPLVLAHDVLLQCVPLRTLHPICPSSLSTEPSSRIPFSSRRS